MRTDRCVCGDPVVMGEEDGLCEIVVSEGFSLKYRFSHNLRSPGR